MRQGRVQPATRKATQLAPRRRRKNSSKTLGREMDRSEVPTFSKVQPENVWTYREAIRVDSPRTAAQRQSGPVNLSGYPRHSVGIGPVILLEYPRRFVGIGLLSPSRCSGIGRQNLWNNLRESLNGSALRAALKRLIAYAGGAGPPFGTWRRDDGGENLRSRRSTGERPNSTRTPTSSVPLGSLVELDRSLA